MRLLALDADDWMPFEGLHLDFASMSGVAITGLNDHGKSAILDAITMCLYGVVGRKTSTRSPDQYIRHGADGFFLKVIFDTSAGQRVTVTREKQRGVTAKLRLIVDGDDQTSAESMDSTQDRIVETIGLDHTALTASAFMVQHDSAAFMVADPRERKDLLIRMLGLDQYEPLHLAAKRVADRALARRDAAQQAIGRLALAIATGASAKADYVNATGRVSEARAAEAAAAEAVSTAREQYQRIRAERDRVKAMVDRANAVAAEREAMPETIASLRDELAEAEAAAAEPEPIIQLPPVPPEGAMEAVIAARDHAIRLVNEGARLGVQLGFERARVAEASEARAVVDTVPCGGVGIYATCPLLAAVPTEDEIAAATESLANVEAMLADGAGQNEVATQWEQERQRLVAMQALRDRASNGARVVMNRWKTSTASAVVLANAHRAALRVAEARAAALELEPEIEAATDDLAAVETALVAIGASGQTDRVAHNAAVEAVRAAEVAWQEATRRVAAVEAAEVAIDEERATAAEAADEYEIHAALAQAWHRDGVPTRIIERALPMIEAKANDILARLPEDLMVTVRTQRPTAKRGRGMAETLDIVVTIDGVEREYGLISWGARLRVDVALRLALGEILAHRSGQRIETIWFDEPLADLDPEGVEAMLELMTAIRDDFPLIVVVSHNQTFSDTFDSRIEVRKVDGISRAIVDGAA